MTSDPAQCLLWPRSQTLPKVTLHFGIQSPTEAAATTSPFLFFFSVIRCRLARMPMRTKRVVWLKCKEDQQPPVPVGPT